MADQERRDRMINERLDTITAMLAMLLRRAARDMPQDDAAKANDLLRLATSQLPDWMAPATDPEDWGQ